VNNFITGHVRVVDLVSFTLVSTMIVFIKNLVNPTWSKDTVIYGIEGQQLTSIDVAAEILTQELNFPTYSLEGLDEIKGVNRLVMGDQNGKVLLIDPFTLAFQEFAIPGANIMGLCALGDTAQVSFLMTNFGYTHTVFRFNNIPCIAPATWDQFLFQCTIPIPISTSPAKNEEKKKQEEELFGMSEKLEESLKKSFSYISEAGVYIAQFLPPLVNLISTLNIIKLTALFPAKYSEKIKSLLEIIVTFPDKGVLGWSPDFMYSQDYIDSHKFVPLNEEFAFHSVYPRMRVMEVLLRILINAIFFMTLTKLSSAIPEGQKKPTFKQWLVKIFIQLTVTLDMTNLGQNLLLIGTSIHF
jgi:hypothetical protein